MISNTSEGGLQIPPTICVVCPLTSIGLYLVSMFFSSAPPTSEPSLLLTLSHCTSTSSTAGLFPPGDAVHSQSSAFSSHVNTLGNVYVLSLSRCLISIHCISVIDMQGFSYLQCLWDHKEDLWICEPCSLP